jgi:stearoyl-CoA desaturase (delta-9 desaturase)
MAQKMRVIMQNISSYKQTQLVIWINQILFFGFLFFDFQLLMIFIAFISTYIFGFMSETSLHRYYTHRSYETTAFKEKILRVFAFLAGQGAILSWVTVHRTHHAYEDTEKDPHSPKFMKWWKFYLALLPKDYKNNLVFDLMKSSGRKYYVFENKYYLYMWICAWLISYMISFYLFFFIVAGVSMWHIATCIVNISSHLQGVKNYPDAAAFDSSIVNFLTGVGNHNTHHKHYKSYTYSVNGGIDIYAPFIKTFFIQS